jgi:epoxide hydrolase-like predicted phosphatase
MIKTVLFDLGNVLMPFDLMRLADQLARFSRFSPEEILQKIAYNQVAEDFETGRLSPNDYFQFVTHACEFKDLSYDQFIAIFNDIFDEDAAVYELVQQLKTKYKLGLISNTNPIHVDHLRTQYPNLSHFEHLWFSNEAGLRKPDPAIYQMALSKFECTPAETVFIDDFEINVKGALALGIQAVHYKNSEQLKSELVKMGVLS